MEDVFYQGMCFGFIAIIAGVMLIFLTLLLGFGFVQAWRKAKEAIMASRFMQNIQKNKEEKAEAKRKAQKEAYYATEPNDIERDDPRYELAHKIFVATHWPSESSVRSIYEAVQEFKRSFKFHEKLSVVHGDYVDGEFWSESFYYLNSWELTLKEFYDNLLADKTFSSQQLDEIQHTLTLQLRLQEAYKNDDLTAFKAALDEGADPEYKYYFYGEYEPLNEGWEKDTLCQRYLLTLNTKNAQDYRKAEAKRKKEEEMLKEAETALAA